MPSKRGILFVISAPSGCGKTTIVNRLIRKVKNIRRSISMTTRKPRVSEKDGRDYFFISRKEFLKRVRGKSFLEWARVFGHYYGTSDGYVRSRLNRGKDVILSIDVQGAEKIKRTKRKIRRVFIFLAPPSFHDLEKRLINRRTDSRSEIKKRLRVAKKELSKAYLYDYVVVNEKVNRTVAEIKHIILRERRRK